MIVAVSALVAVWWASPARSAAAAAGRIDTLESTLAGVTRTEVDRHDTLRFEAMNVRVVNGAGATHTTNRLGNLLVGYNEDHSTDDCVVRAGDGFCVYSGDGAP